MVAGQAIQNLAHLVLGDVCERGVLAVLGLDPADFLGQRLALGLHRVRAAQRGAGVGHLGGHAHQLVDLLVDADELRAQVCGGVAGGLLGGAACLTGEGADEAGAAHVAEHLLEDGAVDLIGRQALALGAVVAVGGAVALDAGAGPRLAVRRHQQAGQQVGAGRGAHAVGVGVQRAEDGLGLGLGDEGFVRVALDHPVLARPALAAALVPAAGARFVDVPDGVPGVGEGVPFDADHRAGVAVDAALAHGLGARAAGGAGLQIAARLVGVVVRFERGLAHRLAVARGAGVVVGQLVAPWRPAAGAPAAMHVLAHAGEALLARHEAVHLVHRLQHRFQNHLADRIDLGHLAEHDLHVALGALVAERLGDVAPAR
ncbi:MAG: hypothetical protein RJP96_02555 [Algiphilus sp.]